MKTYEEVKKYLESENYNINNWKNIISNESEMISEETFQDIKFILDANRVVLGLRRNRCEAPGDDYYRYGSSDNFLELVLRKINYYYKNVPFEDNQEPIDYYYNVLESIGKGADYGLWYEYHIEKINKNEISIDFASGRNSNYYEPTYVYAIKFRVSEDIIKNKQIDVCMGGWYNGYKNIVDAVCKNMILLSKSYYTKEKEYYEQEGDFYCHDCYMSRIYHRDFVDEFFCQLIIVTECYRIMSDKYKNKVLERLKELFGQEMYTLFNYSEAFLNKVLEQFKDFYAKTGFMFNSMGDYGSELDKIDNTLFKDIKKQ